MLLPHQNGEEPSWFAPSSTLHAGSRPTLVDFEWIFDRVNGWEVLPKWTLRWLYFIRKWLESCTKHLCYETRFDWFCRVAKKFPNVHVTKLNKCTYTCRLQLYGYFGFQFGEIKLFKYKRLVMKLIIWAVCMYVCWAYLDFVGATYCIWTKRNRSGRKASACHSQVLPLDTTLTLGWLIDSCRKWRFIFSAFWETLPCSNL